MKVGRHEAKLKHIKIYGEFVVMLQIVGVVIVVREIF